jgi:hypothetical protein
MAAMAAILNERRHWSLTGTFLQSLPISHKEIRTVNSGVLQIIDGNQIQDGCHLDTEWSSRIDKLIVNCERD